MDKKIRSTSNLFGFYAVILTAIITMITFGFALVAIPISGANCPGDCVDYPYFDTLGQYPRDFLWMPLAILLVLSYVTLMVSIHAYVPKDRKIFSQAGLSFGLITAGVLVSDYFIQFSVIPVSLANHETDGLAMLIQYNPHGIFIALEELGYLLMSLSFLFVGLALPGRNRLEVVIRWIFMTGFGLAMVSLVVVALRFGLGRQDRFEVMVISVNWLVLIINGFLLGRLFRRDRFEPE